MEDFVGACVAFVYIAVAVFIVIECVTAVTW